MDLPDLRHRVASMIKKWVNNQEVDALRDNICQLLEIDPRNSNLFMDAVDLSLRRIPGYALEDQTILATRYALMLRINPFIGDLHEESIILSYLAQETLEWVKDERNPRVFTPNLFRLAQRLGLDLISHTGRDLALDCFYEVAEAIEDNHGATYLDSLMLYLVENYHR